MSPVAVVVARARSERGDRLLAADEPLAALQRACGGAIPGPVAIPALAELLRKAWHYRLRLARLIHARDEGHAISAWVEVVPDEDGCEVAVSNWRAAALAGADGDAGDDEADRAALLAQLAELYARLDARQGILAVGRAGAALTPLAAAMRAGGGRPWTDFVTVSGTHHRQPLHWRLLDGAEVSVESVAGRWLARLAPQFAAGGAASGFDLYLIPAALDELPDPDAVAPQPAEATLDGIVGRDLAPALRPPIARIIANAETIRTRLAGPLPEAYAGYAGDIAEAARHLLALVEDLADLDAIEADDFAPAVERIDLAEAARRAAGMLATQARERRIAVETPPEGVAVAATGELRRVLQVLLNLVGNALRYAPEGSTVRLVAAPRGVGAAALTVADEGPGLSRDDQARVFDKFERLGRCGDGGSGLGLTISRRLARAMGGDVTVESAPGRGARFTLELPAG